MAKWFFGDQDAVYDILSQPIWNRSHILSCMSSLQLTLEKQMSFVVKSSRITARTVFFPAVYATSLANGVDPNTLLCMMVEV